MKSSTEKLRWGFVGLLAIGMLAATIALRNSNFYLLFYNPKVWQVINGEVPRHFAFGTTFMPHFNAQINKANDLAAYPWHWFDCLNINTTPELAIKGAFNLIEQINPGELLYTQSDSCIKVSVVVNAHPPYLLSYHFSIKPNDFLVLDSIAGIDSVLLQYARLPIQP